MGQDTGALIKRYIEIRDYTKVLTAKHEEEMKPYKAALETIENALGAELLELNAQNIKTEFGTAMKVKWTQVKLADRPTFMGFVYDDFWKREKFLTSAITKTEVQDWIEQHGVEPPGLDVNTGYNINVRRA